MKLPNHAFVREALGPCRRSERGAGIHALTAWRRYKRGAVVRCILEASSSAAPGLSTPVTD